MQYPKPLCGRPPLGTVNPGPSHPTPIGKRRRGCRWVGSPPRIAGVQEEQLPLGRVLVPSLLAKGGGLGLRGGEAKTCRGVGIHRMRRHVVVVDAGVVARHAASQGLNKGPTVPGDEPKVKGGDGGVAAHRLRDKVGRNGLGLGGRRWRCAPGQWWDRSAKPRRWRWGRQYRGRRSRRGGSTHVSQQGLSSTWYGLDGHKWLDQFSKRATPTIPLVNALVAVARTLLLLPRALPSLRNVAGLNHACWGTLCNLGCLTSKLFNNYVGLRFGEFVWFKAGTQIS